MRHFPKSNNFALAVIKLKFFARIDGEKSLKHVKDQIYCRL